LEELINNSVSLFCDAMLNKKLEVKMLVLPENISIYTDEPSFSTILNNLISNAVKYSNAEGVIEIKTYQQHQQLIVEIKNTGNGIPKEELKHIFEKFYRSYTSENHEIKGFGLGLPIVKRFCSLLDIEIDIESEADQTTVVKLIIPSTFCPSAS